MNLFDYVNALNSSDKDVWEPGVSESEYKPFLINKAMSFSRDTIMLSQEMNQRFHISGKMQYDFYRLAIQPKKKRRTNWVKEKDETIEFIREMFNVSYKKAISYSSILNNDDLEKLKSLSCKGGTKK